MTQPIGNGHPPVIPPCEPAPASVTIPAAASPSGPASVAASHPPTPPAAVDTLEVTSHRTVMVLPTERENHTPRLVASIIVGSAMGFALSPLDVVTSRQRLNSQPVSFWGEATSLAQKHGFRGFFIGASLGAAGGLGRAVNQGFGIPWIQSMLGEAFECSPKEPLVNALAVATSAALDPVLTAPPHRLRILMMSDKYDDIKTVRQAYAKVAAGEGVRIGLYKGFMTNVVRSIGYVGLAFGFSRAISQQVQPDGAWQRLGVVTAGACAAELVTSPLNVVLARTRQTISKGDQGRPDAIGMMRSIVTNEGWRALYKGTLPVMLMNGPRFGATIVATEVLTELFKKSSSSSSSS